jgi:2-phosphosulfolactate phosphatase
VLWHCYNCFHGMPEAACAGGIAVVIDVLRASTTIITALAHGATRVRPVLTIEEARAEAAARDALLGGERGGRRIDGFDLGNSPLEYSRDRVGGRSIVITTTNGTAALHACKEATEVLIGAIVNRTAVAACARSLAEQRAGCDAHLVCAGTEGAVTEEDLLAAGAILDAVVQHHGCSEDALDATGREALAFFRSTVAAGPTAADAINRAFAMSIGGRNLIDLGMDADLPVSAAIDSLPVVPRLGGPQKNDLEL